MSSCAGVELGSEPSIAEVINGFLKTDARSAGLPPIASNGGCPLTQLLEVGCDPWQGPRDLVKGFY